MKRGYIRQGRQFHSLHFMGQEMNLNNDHGSNKSSFSNLLGNYEINNIHMHGTLSPNMFTNILDLDSHEDEGVN